MKRIYHCWIISVALSVTCFAQGQPASASPLPKGETANRGNVQLQQTDKKTLSANIAREPKIVKNVEIERSIRILLDTIKMKDLNKISQEIKVYNNGAIFRTQKAPFEFNMVEFNVPKDEPVTINKQLFSGKLLFHKVDDSVEVINEVGLEDYVKGVLAGEISSKYERSALMSQAIVSRTLAFYRLQKPVSDYYDVKSTVDNQVFFGKREIADSIANAVDLTAGIVFTYNGVLVEPYFCANAGGITELPSNVWGGYNSPVYAHIESPFDEGMPGFIWEQKYRIVDINEMLGVKVPIESIEIKDFTSGRRVAHVVVHLSDGKQMEYTGMQFRTKMGTTNIRSLLFTMERVGEMYFFQGKGYGHGVGLSQEGANAQAKGGRSVLDILNYYYKGISFMKAK